MRGIVGNDSFPYVLSSCVSVPGSLLKDIFSVYIYDSFPSLSTEKYYYHCF